MGNLSEMHDSGFQINSSDLFLRYKTLEGFNLLKYIRSEELSKDKIRDMLERIREDFDSNQGKRFGSGGTIKGGKEYALDKV